jgi:hypothetical protein
MLFTPCRRQAGAEMARPTEASTEAAVPVESGGSYLRSYTRSCLLRQEQWCFVSLKHGVACQPQCWSPLAFVSSSFYSQGVTPLGEASHS